MSEALESPMYRRTSRWAVGIDIGQANDPTAVCALQSIRWEMSPEFQSQYPLAPPRTAARAARWGETTYQRIVDEKPRDQFHIRQLVRLPLGMTYPDQCVRLAGLLSLDAIKGADVFIDATGVGKPISDLFRKAGIKHTPVWITGGRDENEREDGGVTIPKLHLISRLQGALHSGELKIAKSLPEAAAFARELQEFRASWSDAGNIRFGARQGAHDDLVLAAALAIFGATRTRLAMTINMRMAF